MKCPYTATTRVFQKLTAPYIPVVQISAEAFEQENKELLKTYLNLNAAIGDKLDHYAASTVRGNRPVTLSYKEPGEIIALLLASEVHGVLRWMIGMAAKKMDRKSLPENVQQNLENLDKNISQYKEATGAIQELHFKKHGQVDKENFSETVNVYGSLSQMTAQLRTDESVVSKAKVTAEINNETTLNMIELNKSLRSVTEYKLKGTEENIQNTTSNKIKNFAEWHIYASYAARGFANDIKIPTAICNSYRHKMGVAIEIIPKFIFHMEQNEELQKTSYMEVLRNGMTKMQDAMVQCGSYRKIKNDTLGRQLLDITGVTNKGVYNEIKRELSENKNSRSFLSKKTAITGVCPFGYSAKKPEMGE